MAGLAAAIVAGAQIIGGLIVTRVRRLFRRRTDALLVGGVVTFVLLLSSASNQYLWSWCSSSRGR